MADYILECKYDGIINFLVTNCKKKKEAKKRLAEWCRLNPTIKISWNYDDALEIQVSDTQIGKVFYKSAIVKKNQRKEVIK